MKYIEYFASDLQEGLLGYLEQCDWQAGRYLFRLLSTGQFESTLGSDGKLFFLMDEAAVVSFITLTEQDCIVDKSMYPWLGFLYTEPTYRGHRYSEQIIRHALAAAKDMGHSSVFLATDHVGLYEKYGFTHIDDRLDVHGEMSRIYRIDLNALPKRQRVIVTPYDPIWPDEFARIQSEVQQALGEDVLAIEHVGSTSVPGLAAKPIIDIDVVIDADKLGKVIARLTDIGYVHQGDLGIPGREAFKYSGKEDLMKHNLYVCSKDATELKRHVTFRDWLRSHPEDRLAYGEVKSKMAARYPDDIDAYMQGKAACITAIYQKCGLLE